MKKAPARKRAAKPIVNASPAFNNMGPDEFRSMMNGLTDALLETMLSGGTEVSRQNTLIANLRHSLVSNNRALLSQGYVEHGLIQTIVDLPIDDAFRGGIDIKSGQLSTEQVEDVNIYLKRHDIINSVIAQAGKWNRLYGGAGILIIADDAKPDIPLEIEKLGKNSKIAFRAADMWELFNSSRDQADYDPAMQYGQVEFYDYYSMRVHHTRVLPMIGITAPSFIRPRLRGWGISVVEALLRSINQYIKANNLSFEVLDEFKLDIYKFKDLRQTLFDKDGTAKVKQRVNVANAGKNFQNAIVLDSEDGFENKQLSFTGLAEAQKEIRMQVASDMRMPITKLFGVSAAGFSSGEDDIENYNAMVESQVRSKMHFDIVRVVEIVCQHLFEMVPDDLDISFKPLRILSAKEEEEVKTQKFNRLIQAQQAGNISSKSFIDAANKGNLFDIQIEDDDMEQALDEAEEKMDRMTPEPDNKDDGDGGRAD